MQHHPQFRLKDSVYAIEEPNLGLYFRLAVPLPKIGPLRLASLAPATPSGRRDLVVRAAAPLAGMPHELVRVDA
jgi:hypothetical protein